MLGARFANLGGDRGLRALPIDPGDHPKAPQLCLACLLITLHLVAATHAHTSAGSDSCNVLDKHCYIGWHDSASSHFIQVYDVNS